VNRLQHERSPYLRQHRDNPVDWYAWGPEALERAKREDKPILLSVGYSACHWCHVMAHESFEDPEVARLMNVHFINIKVDREERPDVDQLYQGVVQLMGQGGGWPLTVFLTPALRPFFGGTYFPPAPRHGMPSFRALVIGIGEAWKKERAELEHESRTFEQGLQEFVGIGLDRAPGTWSVEALKAAGERMATQVDVRHGGFGTRGPKFPNPMNLAFMLRAWRRGANVVCRDHALLTLEKMALGGIHDHLGGGFARYSVDERWAVPHFEKMLYDNAQLLHLLAEAQWLSPRPIWVRTATRLVEWLTREMTSPEGTFFAAQDADSEGEEGKFFVWTPAEVKSVLGESDGAWACEQLGVTEAGNFEHGTTVLSRAQPDSLDEARLARLSGLLFAAREKRVRPGTDDKVLAGWNGLMIRGLAAAARAFGRPEWAALASRAAGTLAREFMRGGVLHRTAQGLPAMLEDFGDLASGLVALFQTTQDAGHLELAERLSDHAFEQFWDVERAAWRAAPKSNTELFVAPFAVHDNAFPSGASTLAEAQIALTACTGRPRHLERARVYLERMKDEVSRNPLGFGHLLSAVDLLLDGAAELTVVDEASALARVRAELDRHWAPTLSLITATPGATPPAVLKELLAGRSGRGAFLCQHFSCRLPVATEQVASLVAGFTVPRVE
jgi:uncharacterized protein YyaL (SSP411 family)